MKTSTGIFWFLVSIFFSLNASAVTLFVDLNSTNATIPYASWSTASTNIQDAIDASSDGDLVLVTNGIYATGGRPVNYGYGAILTNRVAMTKAVTLRSVNGPAVTVIQGYQMPGTTNGDSAVRGVYMSEGAILTGFTVTNGATRATNHGDVDGGGISSSSLTAVISNCVVSGNSSGNGYGGGIEYATVYNTLIAGNHSLTSGGGTSDCLLNSCILSNNHAFYGSGGGAEFGILNSCLLIGNSIDSDEGYAQSGGADNAILTNCTLIGNSAYYGGGVYACSLYNCLIVSNSAALGGGALDCDLENCTVVENTASIEGGGIRSSDANNSIIYYNNAPTGANYYHTPCYTVCGSINFSCTLPYPGTVPGDGVATAVANITNPPIFIDRANGNFRLQTNSPCINAGSNAYVAGNIDLDGRPRLIGNVDIGAYEFQGPFLEWLQQFGLPTTGSADFLDSDGDGLNNWKEWKAGTVPTNALSVLKLSPPCLSVSGLTLNWQSVAGVTYFLQRRSGFSAQPEFSSISSNIVGQVGVTSYTDTTATNAGTFFYRVGVQ